MSDRCVLFLHKNYDSLRCKVKQQQTVRLSALGVCPVVDFVVVSASDRAIDMTASLITTFRRIYSSSTAHSRIPVLVIPATRQRFPITYRQLIMSRTTNFLTILLGILTLRQCTSTGQLDLSLSLEVISQILRLVISTDNGVPCKIWQTVQRCVELQRCVECADFRPVATILQYKALWLWVNQVPYHEDNLRLVQ